MWVVLLGLLFVGIPIARAFIVQEDESVKIRHEAPGAVTVESFRPGIDSLREWRRKVCSKIDLRATTKLWTQFNWTKGHSWASVKSLSATKYYQALLDANSSTRAVHQLANITAYGVVLRGSRNILAPSFLTMRVATFDNVVLSSRGWVVRVDLCLAIVNGACKMEYGFFNHNTALVNSRRDYIQPNNNTRTLENVYRTFDRVISVAQSSATWHFPNENLPGLMLIPPADLLDPANTLHVSSLTPLVTQWLRVAIGPNATLCLVSHVSGGRDNCTQQVGESGNKEAPVVSVVSGDVYARRATVPEMAKYCGHPSREQFLWLQGRVDSYLEHHLPMQRGWNASSLTNVIGLPSSSPSQSSQQLQQLMMDIESHFREHGSVTSFKLLVLTDRMRSRALKRRDDVNKLVLDWAKEHGYRSYLYSDADAPPSLLQQLLLFRTASIVIGPHGGAEVNAIAMQPLKSCLIEIYPYRMFGHKHVGCYTRMARATNVHFIEMVYQQMGPLSNLSALTDTLAQCQAELLL